MNLIQVHIAHSAVGIKEVLPGNLLVFGIYRSMSTVSRSVITMRERIVNHFSGHRINRIRQDTFALIFNSPT